MSFLPKHSTDFALSQSRDVNMAGHQGFKVYGQYIIRKLTSHNGGKVFVSHLIQKSVSSVNVRGRTNMTILQKRTHATTLTLK
jgi:hypothetical protein